ncbi:MAG: DUF998 domain-containing protein [Pseudomonadota bacterium]
MSMRIRSARLAGAFAPISATAAAIAAGIALEGYSHRDYPLAYLGADGIPGALAFNLFGFLLPGMLAFAVAWSLRSTLPARGSWRPRIGARLAMLSALGFAAQGLLPLQPDQVDAAVNGLHASAWMLWLLACASGAALLASGVRGAMPASVAVAIGVPVLALTPWTGAMVAIGPRLAFLVWLLWIAALPWIPPLRRG